ncbi:GIY-YIG nuclease family protein [Devosia sp. CAU 1758]
MACKRSAVRSRLAPPAFAASQLRLGRPREACTKILQVTGESAAKLPKAKKTDVPISPMICAEVVGGSDLRERLDRHNAGAVRHTAKFRPWEMKTYLAFEDKVRATAFETYLKAASGRALSKKRLWTQQFTPPDPI